MVWGRRKWCAPQDLGPEPLGHGLAPLLGHGNARYLGTPSNFKRHSFEMKPFLKGASLCMFLHSLDNYLDFQPNKLCILVNSAFGSWLMAKRGWPDPRGPKERRARTGRVFCDDSQPPPPRHTCFPWRTVSMGTPSHEMGTASGIRWAEWCARGASHHAPPDPSHDENIGKHRKNVVFPRFSVFWLSIN